MADDDSSELSSVSSLSPPPSDDESDIQLEERQGILKFFHKVDRNPALEPKEATPPRPKREPSPPHEYVLADNPDIAFIVMFRARFTEAFPKSLPNFGPQEIESAVVETIPGERVEQFLCALLGLLLNRKQDVKPGHYNRALEEAIQTHKGQWTKDWENQNPLAGGATFGSMTPVQRLTLLRTLIHWTLSSSDTVKSMINAQYKNRHDDDLNIPLSVQTWGSDGDKRRYFLVEGNDDTAFRVYRESNPAGIQRTWWSVAGTIDELRVLSNKLETQDGGPKARALSKKILASIPRFEATEEKRKRREYRQMRKEQFKRPEPGLSLYEGRTRGKRMKYTYSDDEEFYTDSTNRRSTRNTRNHTPAEPSGPVTTASGRQIRAPNRLNAETSSNGAPSASTSVQGDDVHEESFGPTGRPRRSAAVNHSMNGWASKKRKSQEYDSDEDDEGSEPDFGDDEEDEHVPDEEDEDEEEFDDDVVMDDEVDDLDGQVNGSLMVTFPIRVAFGADGQAVKVPGAPPPTGGIHKHPRVAHRNVIMSDESDARSTDGVSGQDSEVIAEPEGPAAEVISVATKQQAVKPQGEPFSDKDKTNIANADPESSPNKPQAEVSVGTPAKTLPTPVNGTPTSLAFRGSPEKPQHASLPIDVGP